MVRRLRGTLRRSLCSFIAFAMAFAVVGPALPAFAAEPAAADPVTSSNEGADAVPAPPPTIVEEDVSRRDEHSKHYRMSDGSYRAEIFSSPVHFKNDDDRWVEIDTSVVPAEDPGSYRTKRSEVPVTFRSEGYGKRPVRVTGKDWALELDMLGAWEGQKVAAGNRVRYLSVAQSTDLEYETRSDGVKETLLLSSPAAPSSFSFFLSLTGLELRRSPSGAHLLYRPGETEAVGDIGRLLVFDSGVGESYSECPEAEMTVEPVPGGARITYDVPRAWLADSGRTFPVIVDPSVTIYNHTGMGCADTFVNQSNPTATYYTAENLNAGYYTSNSSWYEAYTRFNLGTIPSGAYVHSADYKVYQYNGNSGPVNIGTTNSWWTNTTCWNNRPSKTFLTQASLPTQSGWITADVTPTFRSWVAGTLSNNGLALYQSSTDKFRQFRSGDYGTLSYRPRIVVAYEDPTVSYEGLSGVYKVGDTVTARMKVNTQYPGSVRDMRIRVNGTSSDPSRLRGYLGWFNFQPGSPWVSKKMTDTQTGGDFWVGYWPGETYGTDKIEPLLDEFTVETGTDYKQCTMKWRITEEYGDVQDNDLDRYITMGTADAAAWNSGWRNQDTDFDVLPGGIENPGVGTTASDWFAETDANGDLVPDNANDTSDQGRGAVQLTWEPSTVATGYKVYMHDGNQMRLVDTVTGTTWSSAGKGLYPTDTAIEALPDGTTTNPFTTSGRDLRDDPSPLYRKTAGTEFDARRDYMLKVVPYNSHAGDTPISDCATMSVALENRTKRVHDDHRSPGHNLGDLAGHSASARLDDASLELDITDLSIATWGPTAEISRRYSSDGTATGGFAPGWRFNFEQSVSVAGPIATYRDETGEPHRFRPSGGAWVSPNGFFGSLAQVAGGWTLTFPDRRVLTFDTAGKLISEKDGNGNEVTYARAGGDLTITAANGQQIVVDYEDGKVVSATYATDDGTRRFDYSASAGGGTVTAYAGTSAVTQTVYSYESGKLTGIVVPSADAGWQIGYGSNALTVENDSGEGTPAMRREITCDPSARTASVATFDGETAYAWNPTGTTRTESVPGTEAVTTYQYDAMNLDCGGTSPTGRRTRRVHDHRGNALYEWDAGDRLTSYRYDASGDAVEETDPKGSTTWRTFDEHGNVTVEEKLLTTSGEKSRTEYTHDSRGLTTLERNKIDSTTWAEKAYSDFAACGEATRIEERGVKLSSTADPVTLTTRATFNAFGEQLTSTDAMGAITETNTHNASGRRLSSTDASGVVTHTRYDDLGNETETWRSHESTTAKLDWRTTEYDGASLAVREIVKDANGEVVSTVEKTYDAMGREIRSDDSQVPGKSKAEYDAAGNETASWEEGADTGTTQASTRTETNEEGESESTLDPGAKYAAGETEYNDDGSVAEESEPDGSWTEYDYEEDGDLGSETEPTDEGPAATTYEYDLVGNVRSQRAPDGSVLIYTYDLMGRCTGTRIEGQDISTTEYNTAGWTLKETDFDGIVKTKVYDACGRVLSDTRGSLTTGHAFDALGREYRTTNPDGSVLLHTFDAFGRPWKERHTGTNGQVVIDRTTAYDTTGRPASVTDAVSGRSTEFDFLSDGRTLITEKTATGKTVTRSDGTGLLRSLDATLSSIPVDFSLDSTDTAGRVTGWTTQALGAQVTLAYDEAGRPVLQSNVRPPSTVQTSGGVAITCSLPPSGSGGTPYTYDPETGKKNSDSFRFTFGSIAEDTTYAYDITGRLKSATRNGVATRYAYDPASGALVGAKRGTEASATLTYDSAGRLASRTIPTGGSVAYAHDTLGRRTSSKPSAETSTTYTWSGERLVSYSGPGVSATHVYDAGGQRVRSTVTQGGLSTTTRYDYEGLTLKGLSAERSDGTTWTVGYLYDGGGKPLAGVYASGSAKVPFLAVTTDRGDVRELIDSDGAAFAHYSYDAYGNPIETLSSGTAAVPAALAADIASRQVLRYAGYCYDEASGLYYCSQRYYDPATASFISKDPARDDGEESAYQYCGGEPVGKVDPSGEWGAKVHSERTLAWAKDCGYSATRRGLVKDGNLETDTNPLYISRKYHWYYRGAYDTAKKLYGTAVSTWKKGKKKHAAALKILGRALHCRQDSWGHGRKPHVDNHGEWVGDWIEDLQNSKHHKHIDHWTACDKSPCRGAGSSTKKKVKDATKSYLNKFKKDVDF